MKMDFNRDLPYYLLLAFLASFVILVFQSEGTAGGADDINHYRFARYAFANPSFFFDPWAKPVFTLLCAPVAQLGYQAVRVFNVVLGLGAAWLTFLTARKLDYRQPVLALFLLVFAPMYTLMMLSGMTEIMFSFFLILGIFLFFRSQRICSAVAISLLPFIRTEGFIIFPLFILAFVLNRQWKAVPFLLTGFLAISLAGSFHHGDFFWVITQNPYSGNAADIYGSGKLFHFVARFRAIFGLPFFVLIAVGLLFLPVHLSGLGKEKRPAFLTEILVAFLPFLVYFTAHSYAWWKGMGNSVGELRVMAAVLPSAALLGMFAWTHITELLRAGKNTLNLIGIVLAAWLVFVPFRVHTIPVPLAPQQKLIKEAASWLADTGYTERKIHYFDPFWWLFLGVDPVDNPEIAEGVPDRKDPGRGMDQGEIILWDAHYGPNEGGVPLEKLRDNPDFLEVKVFSPETPFQVLGGHDYGIHIFERQESTVQQMIQALLDEIQSREDPAFRIRLLAYVDCEPAASEKDTSKYNSLLSRSGTYSCLLDEDHAFLSGLEVPYKAIDPHDPASFRISFSHLFESYDATRDPLYVVLSLQDTGEMLFYRSREIKPDKPGFWEEAVVGYKIPESGSDTDILKVYLWNKGGHRIYIDDMVIVLKEPGQP